MKSGKIHSIRFKAGYGFITPDGMESKRKNNIFFHCSKVVDPNFNDLKVNDRVDYIQIDTHKGHEAIDVVAYQD